MSIEELREKIELLERENRLLKERLEKAGISYADIVFGDGDSSSDQSDTDRSGRIKSLR